MGELSEILQEYSSDIHEKLLPLLASSGRIFADCSVQTVDFVQTAETSTTMDPGTFVDSGSENPIHYSVQLEDLTAQSMALDPESFTGFERGILVDASVQVERGVKTMEAATTTDKEEFRACQCRKVNPKNEVCNLATNDEGRLTQSESSLKDANEAERKVRINLNCQRKTQISMLPTESILPPERLTQCGMEATGNGWFLDSMDFACQVGYQPALIDKSVCFPEFPKQSESRACETVRIAILSDCECQTENQSVMIDKSCGFSEKSKQFESRKCGTEWPDSTTNYCQTEYHNFVIDGSVSFPETSRQFGSKACGSEECAVLTESASQTESFSLMNDKSTCFPETLRHFESKACETERFASLADFACQADNYNMMISEAVWFPETPKQFESRACETEESALSTDFLCQAEKQPVMLDRSHDFPKTKQFESCKCETKSSASYADFACQAGNSLIMMRDSVFFPETSKQVESKAAGSDTETSIAGLFFKVENPTTSANFLSECSTDLPAVTVRSEELVSQNGLNSGIMGTYYNSEDVGNFSRAKDAYSGKEKICADTLCQTNSRMSESEVRDLGISWNENGSVILQTGRHEEHRNTSVQTGDLQSLISTSANDDFPQNILPPPRSTGTFWEDDKKRLKFMDVCTQMNVADETADMSSVQYITAYFLQLQQILQIEFDRGALKINDEQFEQNIANFFAYLNRIMQKNSATELEIPPQHLAQNMPEEPIMLGTQAEITSTTQVASNASALLVPQYLSSFQYASPNLQRWLASQEQEPPTSQQEQVMV
ncbi:unnamed protein product, partial [Gongylonema pulchrum]